MGMAYVNGQTPSILLQRGTYTIIKTTALDKHLEPEWYWESTGEYENHKGQGQHSMQTADIYPEYPGMECYAGEARGGTKYFLYSAQGQRLSDKDMGSLNPRPIWWDEDDQKEIVLGETGDLFNYKGDTIMHIEGKILMVGDILGDWREEIVTGLEGELRIYSTTISCDKRRVAQIGRAHV